ncbi:hypothetical protein [Streptomyces sp. 8K308]|uniref:hypothetical protein n=1 Tax=Streptomyces sp. 8K308 TaxID=2530388 RepID=UPI001404DDB2|nr:hypothetical protein [Streptomyces sp. 8K308]
MKRGAPLRGAVAFDIHRVMEKRRPELGLFHVGSCVECLAESEQIMVLYSSVCRASGDPGR